MRIPKDFQAAAKQAHRQGWTIRHTGSGHLVWEGGLFKVFTPSSPGRNNRTVPNTLAKLREAGLRLHETKAQAREAQRARAAYTNAA